MLSRTQLDPNANNFCYLHLYRLEHDSLKLANNTILL